jgi:hypothetical protein
MFIPNHNEEYYLNYLKNVINIIKKRVNGSIKIYIFSEGSEDSFRCFLGLGNVEIKVNCDLMETFYHLLSADVLVAAKSSLSWSAHLFGAHRIVIARDDFWHSWNGRNSILVNREGLPTSLLRIATRKLNFLFRACLVYYDRFFKLYTR